MGIIYIITNEVNGKKYVGQTIQSLKNRWWDHTKRSSKRGSPALRGAFEKYGRENFSIEAFCEVEDEHMDAAEIFCINILGTRTKTGLGYNIDAGGKGRKGFRHSEESKLRMAATRKALWENKAYRDAMTELHRHPNPDTKHKFQPTFEHQSKAARARWAKDDRTQLRGERGRYAK